MKERIEGALFILGLALLFGAFGGMDCEMMSTAEGVLFSLLGITSMMISVFMGDEK